MIVPHTMGAGEWIAFAGLIITIIGMCATGCTVLWRISQRFGEHNQRLASAERDIKELKAAERMSAGDRAELKTLTALLTRVEGALRDMGQDLNRRMEGIEADIRRHLGRGRED